MTNRLSFKQIVNKFQHKKFDARNANCEFIFIQYFKAYLQLVIFVCTTYSVLIFEHLNKAIFNYAFVSSCPSLQ